MKAVDIRHDGTLIVHTRHYDLVKRVMVQHDTRNTLFLKAGEDITEEGQEYCRNCIHSEMCSWYGTVGCEWVQI